MDGRRLLILLLVVGLTGTGTALAQPTGGGAAKAAFGENPCAASGNASAAMAAWRASCRANMTVFAKLSLQHFHENRTLIHAKVKAAEAQAKADFYNGVVAAVESCRTSTAGFGANESGPHSGEFAACMRASMATLKNETRDAARAERTSLGEQLKTAKETAKAEFTSSRDAWLAANPKPVS